MPSISLTVWRVDRNSALDEIENAHRRVGSGQRGRRFATQQINHAFAVLLSSQFQGFCRDLHSECADYIVQNITPASLRLACRNAFVQNRKLDRGNPNPGNLGSDFNRFGLAFWDEVRALDLRNQARQNRLEELNDWRNAIAHQDFTSPALGGAILHLHRVRAWRTAYHQLASSFDEVIRRLIESVSGFSPW